MANVDARFGARPIRHLDGSPYNGMTTRYHLNASSEGNALFIGDFVVSSGSAFTDGVPEVTVASAGGNLLGAIVAFEPLASNPTLLHREASTDRYCLVADSPDIVFAIQEDGTLAATAMGNNAEIVTTHGGSTDTGLSGMEIVSAGSGTGTAQLRVLRPHLDRESPVFGSANGVYDVYINEHEHKSTTGT